MTGFATTQPKPLRRGGADPTASGPGTLDRQVLGWLRLEGLAAFVAGDGDLRTRGGDWLWFVPAFLLVDLSAAGYLVNPRVGAFTYDLFHNWAVGLAILGAGLAASSPIVALAGAVLVAHVGVDRALGYGLKLQTGFKDTHLGRIGPMSPAPARTSRPAILAAARPCSRRAASSRSRMQAVADRVGVRAPSLYKRFPGRPALVAAVAARRRGRARRGRRPRARRRRSGRCRAARRRSLSRVRPEDARRLPAAVQSAAPRGEPDAGGERRQRRWPAPVAERLAGPRTMPSRRHGS